MKSSSEKHRSRWKKEYVKCIPLFPKREKIEFVGAVAICHIGLERALSDYFFKCNPNLRGANGLDLGFGRLLKCCLSLKSPHALPKLYNQPLTAINKLRNMLVHPNDFNANEFKVRLDEIRNFLTIIYKNKLDEIIRSRDSDYMIGLLFVFTDTMLGVLSGVQRGRREAQKIIRNEIKQIVSKIKENRSPDELKIIKERLLLDLEKASPDDFNQFKPMILTELKKI